MNLRNSIQPINEYIEPFKRKSKVHYGFHAYFTTQPFNVVQQYILNYTKEGDLVADPFVGSGVTAVESLRLKRRAFALDINPFAIFLTKVKCSNVDIDKATKMYEKILNRIKDECEAVEKMPQSKAEKLEVPYWYPENIKLPSNSDRDYLHQIFTKKQLYQLSAIKNQIDHLTSSSEKDLLLVLFCGTLSRANIAYSLPDDGRSIFSGDFTIFQTGRYRIPKRIIEIPVLPVFERRFKDLISAKRETNKVFSEFVNRRTFRAVVGSATNIKRYLKDSTVDYIYTDPPYGGHIAYLDLSIVYNAWLGFNITDKMLKQEAIEGGEQRKTRKEYLILLQESFNEISRILKPQRWLSLVFHHREPSIWTNIVETAKKVGLEYKNSVVQHTKLPSWHKIDVPQSVLSSQMIINFVRKEYAHFAFVGDTLSLNRLILNVAEREIVKRHGATLEEIINSLVPELFEHNFIHEEAQTTTDKIFKLISQEFDYNSTTKNFSIRKENRTLGSYIPMQDRLRFYLISFMRHVKKASLEQIIPAILPKIINGEIPSGQEILQELQKIADYNGKHWVFHSGAFQPSLNFEEDEPIEEKIVTQIPEEISEHNKMIYRLALLANRYNLIPKVGQQEQKDPFLKAVNQCNELLFEGISDKHLRNINEIDCLWMTPNNPQPLFAFEVEHTSEISSAFERFLSLLKIASDIGTQRRLILVISKQNRTKFNRVIRESSYIGAPHYINNKIRYIFEDQLEESYEHLMQEEGFAKLEGLLSNPELG